MIVHNQSVKKFEGRRLLFFSNLYIFSSNSLRDIVSINTDFDIENYRSQSDIQHIMMLPMNTITSVF